MIKVVRAKLHGIRVTGADLNYHGSVTLDPEHCREAGLYPLEFVEIWNKSSGARISTYVIHGEPGSRCCVLNGAAARTCQVGDELIIAASEFLKPDELYELRPRILTFLPDNTVDQILNYEVFRGENRTHEFRIVNARTHSQDACHTYLNVNVSAVREYLRNRGWDRQEIDGFVSRHMTL